MNIRGHTRFRRFSRAKNALAVRPLDFTCIILRPGLAQNRAVAGCGGFAGSMRRGSAAHAAAAGGVVQGRPLRIPRSIPGTSATSARTLCLQELRFKGGVVNYLSVLDTQRLVLSSELSLARARLARDLAFVDLYQALGGGWDPDAPPPASD
jgi:hypothetical protein